MRASVEYHRRPWSLRTPACHTTRDAPLRAHWLAPEIRSWGKQRSFAPPLWGWAVSPPGAFFGLSETIITISWIVGPPIGGWIAQQSGYRWMFLIAMLTFGLAMLLFLVMARDLTRDGSPAQTNVSLASLRSSFGEILALSLAGGLVTWILIVDGIRDVAFKMSFDLVATSLGIFSLPAPWIGSQLWGWVGPRAPFILTGLLACLAVLPAWFKLALPKAAL